MNRSEAWARFASAAKTGQLVSADQCAQFADQLLTKFDARFRGGSSDHQDRENTRSGQGSLNPNPRYCVDGYEFPDTESMLDGNGQYPPFRIFMPEKQDYLPGTYTTREDAQQVADLLLNN